MKKLLLLVALFPAIAAAQVVNWLDPLAYEKPRPYNLAMPPTGPEYYVNYSSGSGTACSQAVPCATIDTVAGKAGTNGGPATIYVKGNGYLNITSSTLAGSTSNEIVIKPWPNDSTPTVWTAQSGCGTANANFISGSGMHHVIFDGGPDMLLRFRGSGCATNQNGYSVIVNSSDITFYRVRIDVNSSAGPGLGIATNQGANVSRFRFINSELYGATRYYGVYTGGGATCCSGSSQHTDIEFRNSIIRDADGRGIQIEPRTNSSGFIVDRCSFHNIGKNLTGGSNGVSSAVQPAGACCGETINVSVTNSIGFDLGAGFVHSNGDHPGLTMIGNTVYDYGKQGLQNPASRAFSCSESDGCPGTARNNIALSKPNDVEAFFRTGSWTISNNLCDSGEGCALSSNAASTFLSTSTSSLNFLKLQPSSNAVNAGTSTGSSSSDYQGKNRIGAHDIGAMEQGAGNAATRPKAPGTN